MTKRKITEIIKAQVRNVKPKRVTIARTITVPSAGSAIITNRRPRMVQVNGDSFMVTGTELFSAAITQLLFTATAFPIIPANTSFLNGLAINFSRWKWHSVRFVYVPLCATTVQGLLSFSFNYDFVDATPTNDTQMSTMKGYISTPAWGGADGAVLLNNHRLKAGPGSVSTELDLTSKPCGFLPYTTLAKFTALSNQDKLLYAHSQFISAASNSGVSQTAGQVYIQYVCELVEPTASATQ